ncbi:MAG: serine/threonine protein kinase [Theionarchaea archaeon]|nr:serine/threonine protein kinase [Theionarchaea archaeon]
MPSDIYDVLSYPKRERNNELIREFNELGLTLLPQGQKRVFGIPILGKGWSSLVMYGKYHGREVAVKIQRRDSNRISLSREAIFLRLANAHRIGPTLLFEGTSFLILEYITGNVIHEASVKKEHILSFFRQCHLLDNMGIDHGQIQGGKHLIIGRKCWIIDFEKAGWRIPRNVNSLGSEVFLKKTRFAQSMRALFRVDRTTLISAFNEYKKDFNMDRILETLHV